MEKKYASLAPDQEVFSLFEMLRILGLKRERLRQWVQKKYVQPGIQVASGRGTKNIFSRFNVYEIAVFKKLVDAGIRRWDSAQIVERFALDDWQEIRRGGWKYVTVVRGGDKASDWDESTILGFTPGPPVIVLTQEEIGITVNLEAVVRDVDIRIERVRGGSVPG